MVLVIVVSAVVSWQQGSWHQGSGLAAAPAPTLDPVSPVPEDTLSPPEPLWPGGEPDQSTPRPATSRSSARLVMVTGVGCRPSAEAGYFAAYPAGAVPPTRQGGWAGGGCTGVFWTVPMSGAPQDSPNMYVLWWFAPSGVTRASCDVSVYVPASTRSQDVAGRPTQYLVQRGREDTTVVGSFAIDQTINRGRWVSAGRYSLYNGQIAIRMGNRGTGLADRHAAAQVWLDCVRE